VRAFIEMRVAHTDEGSALPPVPSVGALTVSATTEFCGVGGLKCKSIARFIALWSYVRLRLMPRAKAPPQVFIVVAMCITLLR
jgi:hypothetical protein